MRVEVTWAVSALYGAFLGTALSWRGGDWLHSRAGTLRSDRDRQTEVCRHSSLFYLFSSLKANRTVGRVDTCRRGLLFSHVNWFEPSRLWGIFWWFCMYLTSTVDLDHNATFNSFLLTAHQYLNALWIHFGSNFIPNNAANMQYSSCSYVTMVYTELHFNRLPLFDLLAILLELWMYFGCEITQWLWG